MVIVICIISLQIFVKIEKTIYKDFVSTSSTLVHRKWSKQIDFPFMIGVCSLNVNIGMSFNRAKQANLKQNTKNQHKINTYLHAIVYELEARYNLCHI